MNREEWNTYAKAWNAESAKAPGNQPEDFDNLNDAEQIQLINWVCKNLGRIQTINTNHTTYGFKHYFERDGGFYITNGMFKGAVKQLGFKIKSTSSGINWYLNVSERSVTKLKNRGVRCY